MRNIFLVLFFLLGLGLNAHPKSSPEIISFTIDSSGTISWEIKHSERMIAFQIEEFYNGKWLVISSSKLAITLVLKGQKEAFVNKDKFSLKESQVGGRYRLRITEPTTIISKEVFFKK